MDRDMDMDMDLYRDVPALTGRLIQELERSARLTRSQRSELAYLEEAFGEEFEPGREHVERNARTEPLLEACDAIREVLLNRQPTLGQMSALATRLRAVRNRPAAE